jgi:hypothetical protein
MFTLHGHDRALGVPLATRLAPLLVGCVESDSNRSKEARALFPFGLGNATSANKEATRFESLSDLEEDLDCLLKLGDVGATACWEAPVFDNYLDSNDDPKSFSGSHLGLGLATGRVRVG